MRKTQNIVKQKCGIFVWYMPAVKIWSTSLPYDVVWAVFCKMESSSSKPFWQNELAKFIHFGCTFAHLSTGHYICYFLYISFSLPIVRCLVVFFLIFFFIPLSFSLSPFALPLVLVSLPKWNEIKCTEIKNEMKWSIELTRADLHWNIHRALPSAATCMSTSNRDKHITVYIEECKAAANSKI